MSITAASRRLPLAAIAIGALALLAAPSRCAAAPVGLIEEYRVPANVGDIAAGPEGNLWFTLNTLSGDDERNGIGRITPRGEVTRFRAGLSPETEPTSIVAGPDGNLWFTYDRGFGVPGGGGVGRVTPRGEITEFPEPPGASGDPFQIVAGPDGNLWYQRAALFGETSGGAIGRITPQGEVSTFGAGLRPGAAVTNLVAGPDGNVWFADASSQPAIGRITPAGEITEFGGIPPRRYPILEGPTPGPDGRLWFSANEPTAAVERISAEGTIERFRAGLDRRAEFVGPFAVGADGAIWFRIEERRRHGRGSDRGRTAIGRITVGGRITEFDKCLRPMPQFAGPNFLTLGPDGNVWFTTWPSGEDAHPTRASTPSIGRVTPAGRITELRLGLHPRSQPEDLTVAGGSLWFIDRGAGAIGRIVPPRKPPNTFLVLSPRRGRGSARVRLPVVTPGPGALRLRIRGRRPIVRRARGCGTTVLPVRRGAGAARITFTPRRGSPYTRTLALSNYPKTRQAHLARSNRRHQSSAQASWTSPL